MRCTRITLTFPNGVYSGARLGRAEQLPSFGRLHEAFVAAACGGPDAVVDGRVLVGDDRARSAIEWLEQQEPVGLLAPPVEITERDARRYRWRASVQDPASTPFEPMSAVSGSVSYLWPEAPEGIAGPLAAIAREVTHVGRADSVVIASVDQTDLEPSDRDLLTPAAGRGPGLVMTVARSGRAKALIDAHAAASAAGRHDRPRTGKQSNDELVTGDNAASLALRRFVGSAPETDWAFDEVWTLPVEPAFRNRLSDRDRVRTAIRIHRALVRALDPDVPSAITGRDGDGPLRDPGHVAIQLGRVSGHPCVMFAIPSTLAEADRVRLGAVLDRGLRINDGRRRQTTTIVRGVADIHHAASFWSPDRCVQWSEVPIVLEATGGPRRGPWTIDDAVACSVGYALRGPIERAGFGWSKGWAFRRRLVDHLLGDRGVVVRARRLHGPVGRLLHKADEGSLLVAANAFVDLGELGGDASPWLALGRARHLGGGLMRPVLP